MEIHDGNMEAFDAYLRGKMSGEEVRVFQERLGQDPELAAEFNEYKGLVSGVHKHFSNELKHELEALDAEMDEHSVAKETSNLKRLAWVTAGIAASLLIGLFAYSIFGQTDNIELAQRHWPVEEGLPVKMSNKSLYDDAMNAFKLEQWQEAERQLNALPTSDTTAYFLGNVYFQQAQFKKASTVFKSIPAYSPWHTEAQFRLALTYLAQKKTTEAQALLQEIAAEDSVFSGDAKAVLKEI